MKAFCLLLALGVFGEPAFGQVKLALPEIEGLIVADGSGTYQKLLAEAARRANVTFTADVFPKARALETFLRGSYDGIFTYTQTARDRLGASEIVASYPFGAYRGFVFTLPGNGPISDFSELNGKSVGGILGFEGTYGAITKAGAQLEMVETDSQNLQKLGIGRVSAVLGFLPDLYNQAKNLSFAPQHPFFESYDRLTMRNTEPNRKFLQKLSEALRSMHQDGTVRTLVGPAYLPVSGEFPLDR
jgi:hypothetical protein